jgi:hypothetical protein
VPAGPGTGTGTAGPGTATCFSTVGLTTVVAGGLTVVFSHAVRPMTASIATSSVVFIVDSFIKVGIDAHAVRRERPQLKQVFTADLYANAQWRDDS